MYHRSAALMAIPTIAALLTIGCVDEHIAGNTTTTPAFSTAPAPSGVQTVDIFGDQLGLWPFTGTDLAGRQCFSELVDEHPRCITRRAAALLEDRFDPLLQRHRVAVPRSCSSTAAIFSFDAGCGGTIGRR